MRMNRKTLVVVGLLLVLAGMRVWTAWAAGDDASPLAATDQQILSEIRDHSEVMDNLEYLSDRIGRD